MSEGPDDEHEGHQHGGAFLIDPSALMAEAQRAHDLHRMSADSMKHGVMKMLRGLDQEQMEAFSQMVRVFAIEEDAAYAKYVHGIITALLEGKYNICMACGVDHEKAEKDLLSTASDPFDNVLKTQPLTPERSAELEDIAARQAGVSGQPVEPYVLTEEDLADMEEYNLDDLRDEDTHQLLGFICKACTYKYVSIADRKLRAPDECTGCQIRSGHG
jgi:hypothetical protein